MLVPRRAPVRNKQTASNPLSGNRLTKITFTISDRTQASCSSGSEKTAATFHLETTTFGVRAVGETVPSAPCKLTVHRSITDDEILMDRRDRKASAVLNSRPPSISCLIALSVGLRAANNSPKILLVADLAKMRMQPTTRDQNIKPKQNVFSSLH